ncbi:hypothetical protein [Streptomyces sp. NPDC102462]|uniref:hypothetical protein n=1 Tax=Streptomyces sp. NPDC102462 TaxID=3366178 RepID=UPI00380B7D8F
MTSTSKRPGAYTRSCPAARLREAYGDRELAVAVSRSLMRKALAVIKADWEQGAPQLTHLGG